MEEIGLRIFTEYGPLGFGWVVAFLLWRRLNKRDDAFVDLLRESTAAAVMTNGILEAIKDRLTGGMA